MLVGVTIIIVLVVLAFHVARSYILWCTHFGGRERFIRSHSKCPSHKMAPPVMKGSVLNGSESSRLKKSKSFRLRSSAFCTEFSDKLDMDHIHLPFGYFLWGMTFIWTVAALQALKGLITLRLRVALQHWIKPKPFDPSKVCHDLCLKGALAVHFVGFNNDGTAKFYFSEFPMINKDGLCEVNKLQIDFNLKTKRLALAVLNNDSNLTARETMTLLFFYAITTNHVKIHSLANWAVQVETFQNSFQTRNGIATVMYNYFGYTGFMDQYPTFQAMGLLSPGLHYSALLIKIFDKGISAGVPEHSSVTKLIKYSSFVRFIVKTRSIFIKEFIKYQDSFPNCDVEALFVGSVLHSLDHSLASSILEDPLWFDVDCPKFRYMAEICRIARAAFVDDLQGLAFHKTFRNSGHPFYEAVYKKAAKIDKDLADKMDTCIIK